MAGMTVKDAKEIMRKSMLIPQPAPYIHGMKFKRKSKRRVMSEVEQGLAEVRAYYSESSKNTGGW